MRIGFIGLGRMGANMVALLLEKGHEVVAFDINLEAVEEAKGRGATGASSIAGVVEHLETPRTVFVMVQRKHVQGVIDELSPLLSEGDTIVDSGNTFYKETLERVAAAKEQGLNFIDVGVSGGTERARTGATLMVGGPKEVVAHLEPVFRDLAQDGGYGHMGESGAGHFVKMVHNGIEYGMMQAIGEGMQAIDEAKAQFGTDLGIVLRVYNHGSIVESSLVAWSLRAWEKDPGLSEIEGSVPTGDTEAEMESLNELAHMPALDVALAERKKSRAHPSFSGKFVAAMRNEFGSHTVNKKQS